MPGIRLYEADTGMLCHGTGSMRVLALQQLIGAVEGTFRRSRDRPYFSFCTSIYEDETV